MKIQILKKKNVFFFGAGVGGRTRVSIFSTMNSNLRYFFRGGGGGVG